MVIDSRAVVAFSERTGWRAPGGLSGVRNMLCLLM